MSSLISHSLNLELMSQVLAIPHLQTLQTVKVLISMKSPSSNKLVICVLILLAVQFPLFSVVFSRPAANFHFFYFVLQWPGSLCDTFRRCCYPTIGKPAQDFGIHGLWPNYRNGSYPSNCDRHSSFNQSAVRNLMGRLQESWPSLACPRSNGTRFWSHESMKHGTCSQSILNQHSYFQAALNLKTRFDLLELLSAAGIEPDGRSYGLRKIQQAIKRGTGYAPGIQCNQSKYNRQQIFQIYFCVDTSATQLIQCPVFPMRKCPQIVEFPSF